MLVRPGVMYAIQDMLHLFTEDVGTREALLTSFPWLGEIRTEDALDTAIEAGWVVEDHHHRLVVTERGALIAALPNPVIALRKQLQDIVVEYRPTWAAALVTGRQEFASTVDSDIRQCFEEAELLDSQDQDTVLLLDEMAKAMRDHQDEARLVTGRLGERLTMAFEEDRNGTEPDWIALDTNRAGYDVLSSIDADNTDDLQIECKTTVSRLHEGRLYITRNEWNVALSSDDYIFHLWVVRGDTVRLFIVPANDMAPHVAENQGDGEWTSVEIPFAPFEGHEVEVPQEVINTVLD